MFKSKLLIIITSLILSSCTTSGSGEVDKPNTNLIITEINTGTSVANRAIEISNLSGEEINLNNYSIEVYRSLSKECTERILLDGHKIAANSSFVVAYSGANEEIKSKANIITDKYLNDGSFPVAIAYKEKAYDAVGSIGYNHNFADKSPLLRLKEYFKASLTFDLSEWIRYPINTYDSLGNVDVISEEDLLAGPKLSNEDFTKPFCENESKGSGGLIDVDFIRNIDGDTTTFNYGNSYSEFGISGYENTRYYSINTPEIAHGSTPAAPYGYEAKDFTTARLTEAREFCVQSVSGYPFRETYGRMLGFVWISKVYNPNPEDYTLLNHLIVLNGFSNPAFMDRHSSFYSDMTFKGVSYIEYIYFAQQYAIKNKLNIHSGD